MPVHSFEALFRALNKGELAPIYYFYGSEDVLKDEAVRTIVDQALEPGMRDFNLDQRTAGQLDAEAVYALCNTLPMMADRRVVVLREVETWKRKTKGRAELLKYLEKPSPQTVVILVQGSGEEGEDPELARRGCVVRFDPLLPERAVKWVIRQAGQLGLDIEPAAAEHLVRSVGAELAALTSELAKLASLPADAPLTADRVSELVGVRQGQTQWDWRSAVLRDQTERGVTLIPSILGQPGMSGVKLITALGIGLIGIGIARSLYDKGARGSRLEDAILKALLRSRPRDVNYKTEAALWSAVAPDWPVGRVRSALQAALEADQALKSTTLSDERGVLTDLVLRIGVRTAEAAA